jgi:CelD/BcsL family acetyltransferase involved in cellulose biosynthesis
LTANISKVLSTNLATGHLAQEGRSDSLCDVTIAEGGDAVERVAAEWSAIEDAGGIASPFQSLAAARAAATAHLAHGETPRIVVVRDRGRPVVIFPTVVGHAMGVPTIRFLGDPFVQYGDAIAAPQATTAHIESALAAAADETIASVAFFRRVRADAVMAGILARSAATVSEDRSAFVDLQADLKLRSRHARELRRLRRRLSEQGAVRFEIFQGMALGELLRETLEFKRHWLIERGLPSVFFGNPRWQNVLFSLAGRRCGQAEMMMARLAIGGVTAATEIGFVDRRTWFAYIGALAPAFAQLGPGHVLMEELIAWCRNSGLTTYDLLPPLQPYKLALTAQAVPVCDYAVALGLAGYPAIFAARMAPAVKKLVARAPLSLRRRFVRYHLGAADNACALPI